MLSHIVKLLAIVGVMLLNIGLSAQAAEVRITFNDVKNSSGTIRVALYDKADNFLGDDAFMGLAAQATEGDVDVVFKDVGPGEYAITSFHDENGDGELDTNFMGIPKEGLGVSNDAPSSFGPPKFKDAVFTVTADDVVLEINMRY